MAASGIRRVDPENTGQDGRGVLVAVGQMVFVGEIVGDGGAVFDARTVAVADAEGGGLADGATA
jgi:hypothetical protein